MIDQVDTGGNAVQSLREMLLSPRVKRPGPGPGPEADRSSPSVADVKTRGVNTFTPPYVSCHGTYNLIMPRSGVPIDGVWIDDCIH
jgi:hypothetical protein